MKMQIAKVNFSFRMLFSRLNFFFRILFFRLKSLSYIVRLYFLKSKLYPLYLKFKNKTWGWKISWCLGFNIHLLEIALKKIYRIRYRIKGNEYVDKLAFVVRVILLTDKPPNDSFYNDQKDIVDLELESIRNNPEIVLSLKIHFLLRAYKFRKSRLLFNMYFEKAKALDNEMVPLDKTSFNKLYKALKQEADQLRKEEKESNKAFPRFNISFDQVKALLWLFSILFLCTGVIYNQLYLTPFGIEVSRFFNLNDYLNTSIDKIFFTIIPLVFVVLITIFLPFEPPARPLPKGLAKSFSFARFSFLIMIGFCSFFTIYYFYVDDERKYIFIPLLVGYGFPFLMKNLTNRFVNIPSHIYYFIFVACFFVSNIIISTMNERESIYKRNPTDLNRYNIKFEQIVGINPDGLVFLTANSNYYFFYSKKSKKAIIIPSKNITYIETVK